VALIAHHLTTDNDATRNKNLSQESILNSIEIPLLHSQKNNKLNNYSVTKSTKKQNCIQIGLNASRAYHLPKEFFRYFCSTLCVAFGYEFNHGSMARYLPMGKLLINSICTAEYVK